MILSTKLLVATLSISHFSGVVGSKDDREQLRRNLRQGERKAQCKCFTWNQKLANSLMYRNWKNHLTSLLFRTLILQTVYLNEGNEYDDYFEVEPVADISTPPLDDFFTDTE